MTTHLSATLSVILFLLSSSSSFCIQANPALATQPVYNDLDGYVVLSLLLDQETSRGKFSTIDILTVTTSGQEVLNPKCLKVPEAFQSADRDFRKRNKIKLRLTDAFSLKAKYKLIEKPDVELPPQAPGEQQLEEKFVARVFFYVSAVGFDQTKTHAVAYVSAYCGGLCGGGGYHLLVKEKQGWKEIPDSPKCQWTSRNQEPLGALQSLL